MSTYQKVVGPATVTLVAPTDEAITLGQVHIVCDTTLGAVTVNLPAISSLGGALNMQYIVTDNAGLAATNAITVVADTTAPDKINNQASFVMNTAKQIAVFSVGDTTNWIQNNSTVGLPQTTATATVDGLTTGIIPNGNVMVTVTSAAGGNLITLPAPKPGMVVKFFVGANGCNIQANDPTTVGINGGIGAGKKSAIAANTYVELKASTALNWIGQQFTTAGVQTAVAVAA